jgi:hypothetical protein
MVDSLNNVYYYLNDHLGSAGHTLDCVEAKTRPNYLLRQPPCGGNRFVALVSPFEKKIANSPRQVTKNLNRRISSEGGFKDGLVLRL